MFPLLPLPLFWPQSIATIFIVPRSALLWRKQIRFSRHRLMTSPRVMSEQVDAAVMSWRVWRSNLLSNSLVASLHWFSRIGQMLDVSDWMIGVPDWCQLKNIVLRNIITVCGCVSEHGSKLRLIMVFKRWILRNIDIWFACTKSSLKLRGSCLRRLQ